MPSTLICRAICFRSLDMCRPIVDQDQASGVEMFRIRLVAECMYFFCLGLALCKWLSCRFVHSHFIDVIVPLIQVVSFNVNHSIIYTVLISVNPRPQHALRVYEFCLWLQPVLMHMLSLQRINSNFLPQVSVDTGGTWNIL